MNKFFKLLLTTLSCLAIVLSGSTVISQAEEPSPLPSSIRIYGTVTWVSQNGLRMIRKDAAGADQEIILNLSSESKILNSVSGDPVAAEQIQEGEFIYADISPVMTLSLPPMSNAITVLCKIPADYQVPEYITVASMNVNSDGNTGILTSDTGKQYSITDQSKLFPYLTRNIVTVHDLSKGRNCLVWSKDNTVSKIMVFPNSGKPDMQTGWIKKDSSWYFYDVNGLLYTGWLNHNGDWYYLDPETGIMRTGFLTLEGNTYYLQKDGRMLTSAKTFIPDENGVLR
ncbi:N-acetylmuramoyl-L-alanine amidase family protein [Lacrimispora brassicae]